MAFPSPAADYSQDRIDLNRLLIKHPSATYFMRTAGQLKGILTDDLLIIDRSLKPRHGSIVIAVIDGEFCLRQMKQSGRNVYLVGENVDRVKATDDSPIDIWGVVTNVIREV